MSTVLPVQAACFIAMGEAFVARVTTTSLGGNGSATLECTLIGPPEIERGNAPGLSEPPGYTHFATARARRLVFLAGQVPLDERGELVGVGDHVAQARRCLTNLGAALRAVRARPDDAVRTTVYVVASQQRHMGEVWRAILESDLGDIARTAATLLGVARLGYEGQLVEIEVTVAVAEDQGVERDGR
jgi:enamine deaminase RidA (YjgF/YER057c/UK114 family)